MTLSYRLFWKSASMVFGRNASLHPAYLSSPCWPNQRKLSEKFSIVSKINGLLANTSMMEKELKLVEALNHHFDYTLLI